MVRALDSVNEPGNQISVGTERAFLKLNARLVQHTDHFFTTIVSVPTTITAYLLNG